MTRSANEGNSVGIATAFPTDMGWAAIRWASHSVRQLVFAHRSRAAALAAVQAVGSGACQVRDAAHLTSAQRALAERVIDTMAGRPVDFCDVEIDLEGRTTFQRNVLERCRKIAWGETKTYGELARLAGRPGAARAVGTVMATNRFPLIVPCHRVVPAGGKLGGFSAPGGVDTKQRLLQQEGAAFARRSILAS